MELTTEQKSKVERGLKKLRSGIGLTTGLVAEAIGVPLIQGLRWPTRLMLLALVMLAWLAVWLWLRYREVERSLNTLKDELRQASEKPAEIRLSEAALSILCLLVDSSYQTDRRASAFEKRFGLSADDVSEALGELERVKLIQQDFNADYESLDAYYSTRSGRRYVQRWREGLNPKR